MSANLESTAVATGLEKTLMLGGIGGRRLRKCPICCGILDPLRVVRLEGQGYTSEYELAFPEMAWDVGYLIHLCSHLHPIKPTKAEPTFKIRGETVLDHVVF